MRKIAALALSAIFPAVIFADQLVLNDGTTFNGEFLNGNSRTITFRDMNGVRRTYNRSNIQSVEFGNYNQAGVNQGYNGPGYNQNGYYQGNQRFVPAGTQISVRSNETINSNTASVGQTFPAQIVNDVVDPNGNVIVPAGSPAMLTIQNQGGGGTFGSPQLTLALQSVTVNGRQYMVTSSNVQQSGNQGIGLNRRTAEFVGGGAALGTLLGAVTGGGTGGLIGALAGAAAGTAVQVLTRGNQVQVPAETVMNFQLQQPLVLQPVQG